MLAVARLARPGVRTITLKRALDPGLRHSRISNRAPSVVPPYAARGLATTVAENPSDSEWIQLAPRLAETVGEPPLSSLGLGGWTPPGLLESALECLHVNFGLPWWAAIGITTVCIRITIFPAVIYTRRHLIEFQKILPQMTHIQTKFAQARKSGDRVQTEYYAMQLNQFMAEKKVNPFKNFIGPLAQMPFFLSFFLALRKMADVPVASMTTGGLFWFTDLTIPDQFYGLPILTCATMWLTLKVGADTGKITAPQAKTFIKVLQFVPLITLPIIANFPAALLCYWTTTNAFSLLQAGFLSIPKVQKMLKIESSQSAPIQFQDVSKAPQTQDFMTELKESWKNVKISSEVGERQRIDELRKKATHTIDLSSVQAKKKSE